MSSPRASCAAFFISDDSGADMRRRRSRDSMFKGNTCVPDGGDVGQL
jgi:hypothetical protein